MVLSHRIRCWVLRFYRVDSRQRSFRSFRVLEPRSDLGSCSLELSGYRPTAGGQCRGSSSRMTRTSLPITVARLCDPCLPVGDREQLRLVPRRRHPEVPWMNEMNSGTVVPKCGTAPPAPHLRDAGRRASGVTVCTLALSFQMFRSFFSSQ